MEILKILWPTALGLETFCNDSNVLECKILVL